MDLANMTVHRLVELLQAGDVSSVQVTQAYLERIEQLDKTVGAYITVTPELALGAAAKADKRRGEGDATPLLGVPVAVKDNLCTDGVLTTGASRILANFVPPYDATVVQRLKQLGMPILGKTNMDELSMGSSTETSAHGVTRNPWDTNRVPGGSSGGSAAAVAARLAPIALGSDSGGSIRQPAAFTGTVGLKPTYGRVSRYGMIAFAPSLDQIGPFANNVTDAALLLQAIAGHDEYDGTSVTDAVPDYVSGLADGVKGLKIGWPTDLIEGGLAEGLSSDVKEALTEAAHILEAAGAAIVPITLPHAEIALPAYYVIASAEAASSLGRLDGVRYGVRDTDATDVSTMFRRTRGQGFGAEAKRRIVWGTYIVAGDRYETHYIKAMQARTLIKADFMAALNDVDTILLPTTPDVAFALGRKTDDPVAMYLSDLFTIPVNLAGLPALSLPSGLGPNGLPLAVQLVGRPMDEARLLATAYALEAEWGALPAPTMG